MVHTFGVSFDLTVSSDGVPNACPCAPTAKGLLMATPDVPPDCSAIRFKQPIKKLAHGVTKKIALLTSPEALDEGILKDSIATQEGEEAEVVAVSQGTLSGTEVKPVGLRQKTLFQDRLSP